MGTKAAVSPCCPAAAGSLWLSALGSCADVHQRLPTPTEGPVGRASYHSHYSFWRWVRLWRYRWRRSWPGAVQLVGTMSGFELPTFCAPHID
jgi:hypothetical protein